MSLTQARLRSLINYDATSGLFTWACDHGRRFKKGTVAGCETHGGVILIGIDGRLYRAHRLAFLWMNGAWPGPEVDHKDHCPSNNTWANLRSGNKSFNMQNLIRSKSTNRSGFLGVSQQGLRWFAKIYANGKKISLGGFGDPVTAHKAYVDAKRKLHQGGVL